MAAELICCCFSFSLFAFMLGVVCVDGFRENKDESPNRCLLVEVDDDDGSEMGGDGSGGGVGGGGAVFSDPLVSISLLSSPGCSNVVGSAVLSCFAFLSLAQNDHDQDDLRSRGGEFPVDCCNTTGNSDKGRGFASIVADNVDVGCSKGGGG